MEPEAYLNIAKTVTGGMARNTPNTLRDTILALHPILFGMGMYQIPYLRIRMLNPSVPHEIAALQAWNESLVLTTKVLSLLAPGSALSPEDFIKHELEPFVRLISQIGPFEFHARLLAASGGPFAVAMWPVSFEALMRLPQDAFRDMERANALIGAQMQQAFVSLLPSSS